MTMMMTMMNKFDKITTEELCNAVENAEKTISNLQEQIESLMSKTSKMLTEYFEAKKELDKRTPNETKPS